MNVKAAGHQYIGEIAWRKSALCRRYVTFAAGKREAKGNVISDPRNIKATLPPGLRFYRNFVTEIRRH